MKYTFDAEVTNVIKHADDIKTGLPRYASGVEFCTDDNKYSTKTVFLPTRLELGTKLQVIITDEVLIDPEDGEDATLYTDNAALR